VLGLLLLLLKKYWQRSLLELIPLVVYLLKLTPMGVTVHRLTPMGVTLLKLNPMGVLLHHLLFAFLMRTKKKNKKLH
jgi:hypothetical protein